METYIGRGMNPEEKLDMLQANVDALKENKYHTQLDAEGIEG